MGKQAFSIHVIKVLKPRAGGMGAFAFYAIGEHDFVAGKQHVDVVHFAHGTIHIDRTIVHQITRGDQDFVSVRFRTHNQKITAAARAIAERKTVGDLS